MTFLREENHVYITLFPSLLPRDIGGGAYLSSQSCNSASNLKLPYQGVSSMI